MSAVLCVIQKWNNQKSAGGYLYIFTNIISIYIIIFITYIIHIYIT